MNIPRIITHKNMDPLLEALTLEPEFQPGEQTIVPDAWYRTQVILEVPSGELCKDFLSRIALVGASQWEPQSLDGTEGFNAQGLEGKVQIKKDLFGALMVLRDIIPVGRGRIISKFDFPLRRV